MIMPQKMTVNISDIVAKYVQHKVQDVKEDENRIIRELLEEGYEAKLGNLYRRYVNGEITFRNIARELGLESRELYQLLEEKHLPF